MGFVVICRFPLSMLSLSCYQGGKKGQGAVGLGNAKCGIRRPRDHRAVGRAMILTGLIPKFPHGHGAGRREEERRTKSCVILSEESRLSHFYAKMICLTAYKPCAKS